MDGEEGKKKRKRKRNVVVLIHVTEIVAERSDNRSSNVQSFEPRVFSSHSAFFFPFLPDLRSWHGSRLLARPTSTTGYDKYWSSAKRC